MPQKHSYPFTWKGIEMTISCKPDCGFGSSILGDQKYSHIEVSCDKPLPISKTGYRSLFIRSIELEAAGGAVALITRWLDEAAQDREWKQYVNDQNQLRLF